MKEITSISLDRLNNGAHFTFVTNVLTKAEADTKVSNRVAPLILTFKNAVKKEEEALITSKKSLLSDKIAETDHWRDTLYSGYKKGLSGFKDFPVEEQATAYKVLWQHVKDYNINPKDQLDKETGLLINFINDLQTKLAPHVATLGLTVLVEKLKDANEQLRNLTASRTEEISHRETGALRNARLQTDEAYKNIVRTINAVVLLEGEADYIPFIDYMNTEITHYKREVIYRRKTSTDSTPQPEE